MEMIGKVRRMHCRDKKSVREIARTTGLSRNTMAKWLEAPVEERPRCLCVDGGVEMYIARLANPGCGFIVKRMPDTGSRMRRTPVVRAAGRAVGARTGARLGDRRRPATGETTLKLDFALSRLPGRSTVPPAGNDGGSVRSDGTKLSLRGLLRYLWEQAELTRWQPGSAGRRSWATVRKHLLMAEEHKVAKGDPLLQRLYVPEVFSVEQRDAINARRMAQWSHAAARPGKPQQLMPMLAEVKEIVPARYGKKGSRQARAGSGVRNRRAAVPATGLVRQVCRSSASSA